MATEDIDVVRRFWQEIFNEGNLDLVDELFASDHVLHASDLPAEERGPYGIRGLVAIIRKVSPSIQLDLQDEIVAEDKVVSRWVARGTLADDLKNAGVRDNEVTISGISIFRLSDSEITETWHQFEVPRDESEELRLPEEVREQWLSSDRQISEILGDPSKWIPIICRICRCCHINGNCQ
jgi:SnoaL-like polyketide cyclase